MIPKTSIVTGAAGFIGSHLTDRLLALGQRVIGLENLSLGRLTNLADAIDHPRFCFVEVDLNDSEECLWELENRIEEGSPAVIWHLAGNSDIQAGTADPELDLRNTFFSTINVIKLAKALDIRQLVFTSSSAVYGPREGKLSEDTGPLLPVSNYGAMKLASEGAISAATESFLERAWILRLPNVVGSRATHGVIYDFIKKLQMDPGELEVLGNGGQTKPYVHVSDLVDALLFVLERARQKLNLLNIGNDDSGTSVRMIAEQVVRALAPGARIEYGDTCQGWVGDIPRFQYSCARLRQLGWTPRLSSDEAISLAIRELTEELSAAEKLDDLTPTAFRPPELATQN